MKARYDIHQGRHYHRRPTPRHSKGYSRAAPRLLAQNLTNTEVLPNLSTPVVNHIYDEQEKRMKIADLMNNPKQQMYNE